ncbi:MAG: ExbD/TolR family protein [Planctomycetaceae bacterium]
MKRPIRRPTEQPDPMNALIDVVFLLLIFFVCASTGSIADQLLPAELEGDSAEVKTEKDPPPSSEWDRPILKVRLQPSEDGRTQALLNGQALADSAELALRLTTLAQLAPDSTVVLNIHDAVKVSEFIQVYDLCQRLKFANISFAVQGRSEP